MNPYRQPASRSRLLTLFKVSFGTTLLPETRCSSQVVVKIARRPTEATTRRRLFIAGASFLLLRQPEYRTLFDVGMLDDGRPYLVLEWIDGANLRDILAGGPLPLHPALAVLRALTEALAAAHAVGIIHRDIKPSNVMVPQGMAGPLYDPAKRVDFGAFGRIRRATGTMNRRDLRNLLSCRRQLLGQDQSTATDVMASACCFTNADGTTPLPATGGGSSPEDQQRGPIVPHGLPPQCARCSRWLVRPPPSRRPRALRSRIMKSSEMLRLTVAADSRPAPGDVKGNEYPSPPPHARSVRCKLLHAARRRELGRHNSTPSNAAPKSSGWSFKNPWTLLGTVGRFRTRHHFVVGVSDDGRRNINQR